MRTSPLATRAVAVVLAAAVLAATAGSALAQADSRRSCAAMAAGEPCGCRATVASCCCADAHPVPPSGCQALVPTGAATAAATPAVGWLPAPKVLPACALFAPTHGYQSVPLHTLHSTLLI